MHFRPFLVTTALLASLMAALVVTPARPAHAAGNGRTPLLMDGKKTLYMRVLTRPGAMLKRDPGDGAGAMQPALTRFYVYSTRDSGGKTWLEVGLTAGGNSDGWIAADTTILWKQQMALAFTNPAGRGRSLLMKERKDVMDVIESGQAERRLDAMRQTILAGRPDPRVVSIEPENYVDISRHFYLLPILQAEEVMTDSGNRLRVLQVASVSARDEGNKQPPAASANSSALRNFNAAVVFVIDSTLSMDPYIDRVRQAVQRISERIGKAGLNDKVRFGLVAFRSSTDAVPGLEYVSRVYADPLKVRDGADFLRQVAGLKAATISSALVVEDSFGGTMAAINSLDWTQFGGRHVVLITDAGAISGHDALSSTGLDAGQVRMEAAHRGIALYTLHLRAGQNKKDQTLAESQYKEMTTYPSLSQPLYYPVENGSVAAMGQMVDSLADAIVTQVNAASRGETTAGSAASADPGYGRTTAASKDEQEKERLRRDIDAMGHAMQLAWLGRTQGTSAPALFNGWLTDRDPAHPEIPTTEVRVLMTRNQLSDMQQVLQGILKVGQAAQLSPADFFSRMRSVAAVLGRDPNAVNSPRATRLADLGLMGEYLDGLPYHSKILDVDQELWSGWSISQQQAFLDEIQRKLRLYQIYHDDTGRWVALDGGADPGEAVYPVPLDALP